MNKFATIIALVVGIASFTVATAQAEDPASSVSNIFLDLGCVSVDGAGGAMGIEAVTFENLSDEVVTVEPMIAGGVGSYFSAPGAFFRGKDLGPTPIPVTFDPLCSGDKVDVLTIKVTGNDSGAVRFFTIDLIATGGESSIDPNDLIGSIIVFFDESVSDLTLQGSGNGNKSEIRLKAMKNRLETINFLIQNDYISAACAVTQTAIKRCDSESGPNDFVEGDSADELNNQLECLKLLLDN